MKRFLVPFAASVAFVAGPSCASPQPEYLVLESLQNADEERREFRTSIRKHFPSFHQVCPQRAPENRAQDYAQSLNEIENLIASFQDGQLILDANITYHDEIYALAGRRAVVRCRIATMTDEQVDASLAQRRLAIEEITAAANAALLMIHEGAE